MRDKPVQKNVIIYFFAKVINGGSQFIFLPLFSHFLNPSEYAIIVSLELISVFIQTLSTIGVERVIVTFWYNEKIAQNRNVFVSTILIITTLSASLIALLIYFTFPLYIDLVPGLTKKYYVLLIILRQYFLSFLILPKSIYQITNQAIKYFNLNIIYPVINLIILLLLINFFPLSVDVILLVALFSSAIALLIVVKNIFPFIESPYFDKIFAKKTIKFAWPFFPALFFSWIITVSNRILLDGKINNVELANFGMSQNLSQSIILICSSMLIALTPKIFSNLNNLKTKDIVNKMFYDLFIIYLAVYFFLSIWQIIYCQLFLSSSYLMTSQLIKYQLAIFLFSSFSGAFGLIYNHNNKTKINMLFGLISCVIYIALNFLLIPQYGILGALIGTFVANFSIFLIQNYYLHFNKIFIIKINRILILFIISFSFIYYIENFIIENLITSAVFMIIFSLISIKFFTIKFDKVLFFKE